MSALTQNKLASQLNVYSQIALDQYIASMPKIDLFVKSFDSEIQNGGQSVFTRLPNTSFASAPADLTQGWNDETASAALIQINLGLNARSEKFNELDWATLTDTNIRNWFLPQLAAQTANDVVVSAINNVTSSVFTNTLSVPSSSQFAITGAFSLQQASTKLSNNEMPEVGRYAIFTPAIHQALMAGQVYQTFTKNVNEVLDANNVRVLSDFITAKYARFFGASLPQGGSKYSKNDKLVGIAGVSQGLVAAIRQPVAINAGTTFSSNAVDPTSGISLQVRLSYDPSSPVWRLAVLSLYGTAAGNPLGIIPIITQSN
jgi:hypothetical protein